MAGAGLNSRHRFAANTVGLRMCLPIHARGIADSKGAHSVVYLDDVVLPGTRGILPLVS